MDRVSTEDFAAFLPVSSVRVTRRKNREVQPRDACNTARFEIIVYDVFDILQSELPSLASWQRSFHSRIPCCVARGEGGFVRDSLYINDLRREAVGVDEFSIVQKKSLDAIPASERCKLHAQCLLHKSLL